MKEKFMKKLGVILFIIIITSSLFAQTKERVAVLDFGAKGVRVDLAGAIVENFITSLVDSGAYDVIERSQLQKLMNELSMQNSDDFNDTLRQELGNLYGAELVFLGSITKIGDTITINVRGVEVGTGVAKFAKKVSTSSEKDIPRLLDLLVDVILGKKKDIVLTWSSNTTTSQDNNTSNNTKKGLTKEKLLAVRLAMGISTGILVPTTILTAGAGLTMLIIYGANALSKPIGLNFLRSTTVELGVRNGGIALLVIGGICLPLAIVAGALTYFFKKELNRFSLNISGHKRPAILSFEPGLRGDGLQIGFCLSI